MSAQKFHKGKMLLLSTALFIVLIYAIFFIFSLAGEILEKKKWKESFLKQ